MTWQVKEVVAAVRLQMTSWLRVWVIRAFMCATAAHTRAATSASYEDERPTEGNMNFWKGRFILKCDSTQGTSNLTKVPKKLHVYLLEGVKSKPYKYSAKHTDIYVATLIVASTYNWLQHITFRNRAGVKFLRHSTPPLGIMGPHTAYLMHIWASYIQGQMCAAGSRQCGSRAVRLFLYAFLPMIPTMEHYYPLNTKCFDVYSPS